MKSIIFLGDSYTAATGVPEQDRYAYKLSAALGMGYHNWAVGGTGILPYESQTDVKKQFDNGWAALTPAEKLDVEMIIIAAGRNDGTHYQNGTLNQWMTAVDNLLNDISQKFKAIGTYEQLKVYVAPMLNRWIALDEFRVKQYCNFVQALTRRGSDDKFILIDRPFTWMIGHNETRLSDNAHYNAVGHDLLYKHFMSAINGHNYTESHYYKFNLTGTQGVGSGVMRIRNNGGIAMLALEINCTETIPANTNFLADITAPACYPFVTLSSGVAFPVMSAKGTKETARMLYSAVFDSGYNTLNLLLRTSYPMKPGLYNGNVTFDLGMV